ncbi:hypothetical protein GGR58DRAFT_303531 [Xylaria digitata]|nr:hypothetical protein GGR58DRAFT_303531 [Xylaria digitata]
MTHSPTPVLPQTLLLALLLSPSAHAAVLGFFTERSSTTVDSNACVAASETVHYLWYYTVLYSTRHAAPTQSLVTL